MVVHSIQVPIQSGGHRRNRSSFTTIKRTTQITSQDPTRIPIKTVDMECAHRHSCLCLLIPAILNQPNYSPTLVSTFARKHTISSPSIDKTKPCRTKITTSDLNRSMWTSTTPASINSQRKNWSMAVSWRGEMQRGASTDYSGHRWKWSIDDMSTPTTRCSPRSAIIYARPTTKAHCRRPLSSWVESLACGRHSTFVSLVMNKKMDRCWVIQPTENWPK